MIKEHKEHNEHNERVAEMKKELLANLKSMGGGGSVTWVEEEDGYCVEGSGAAIVTMAFACARTVIENRIGDPMAFVETIRFMVMTEGLGQHDAEEGPEN
jgi:hypothetical protein